MAARLDRMEILRNVPQALKPEPVRGAREARGSVPACALCPRTLPCPYASLHPAAPSQPCSKRTTRRLESVPVVSMFYSFLCPVDVGTPGASPSPPKPS